MTRKDIEIFCGGIRQIEDALRLLEQCCHTSQPLYEYSDVWVEIKAVCVENLAACQKIENDWGYQIISIDYIQNWMDEISKGIQENICHKVEENLSYILEELEFVHSLYNHWQEEWHNMYLVEEHVYRNFHKKYISPNVKVGAFTYGIPNIWNYKEGIQIEIGKFCSIASGVNIMLGGEHNVDLISTYPFNMRFGRSDCKGHPFIRGDIHIGNDVWIGSGVRILSGVTIGDGCIIGANSLVNHDIPPYTIVGGLPAKEIRKRFQQEEIEELMKMQWWNWEYKKIYDAMPLIMGRNVKALLEYYHCE